jgi:16S rRNA (cytidine1402-2'-O)-methyltransferase
MMVKKSTLYIVATPIGNMQDITLRAIDTLKEVDYIVSEDTRQTVKILNHFDIKKQQLSYRDETHYKMADKIFALLEMGNSLALVSDSGTPLISDPGYKLVNEVIQKGYDVESIPGASAVIAALSISGLPTDKFAFVGFLPRKGGARTDILEQYGNLDCTMVIYESPYRINKLLEDIYKTLGERTVFVAREMTKKFEEKFFGKLSDVKEIISKRTLKGEFVVLVAKKDL